MCNETVSLTTRSKAYDVIPNSNTIGSLKDKAPMYEPSFFPPPSSPLQIERPISDTILGPPKGTIRKAIFNPNAKATQNYNIVEGLAQAPCAMSTLEVLQHCPMQRRTLFPALRAIELETSNHIVFNLEYLKMRLSHQLAFQIHMTICGKKHPSHSLG